MQLLSHASTGAGEECARDLLDVVLQLTAIIRRHMRRHRSGLTVPQFRTLCYVGTASGCSLSAVAEFIGLSLAAMSRLVDGLVKAKLLERRPGDDRRHVQLSLTDAGQATVAQARELAQAHLAESLGELRPEQRQGVASTVQLLRALFSPEAAATDLGGNRAKTTEKLPTERLRIAKS